MKFISRLFVVVFFLGLFVTAANASSCKVAVLGFDEEIKFIDFKGVQWLRLDGQQVRRFGARDILFFDAIEQGREFSYVSGPTWTTLKDRYYVECEDDSLTYLQIEDNEFKQLDAATFAKRATEFRAVKKVDVSRRKFAFSEKPFADLSQLAHQLGVEPERFTSQAASKVAKDSGSKAVSPETLVLDYHGSTEKCNVAVLGFELEGTYNNARAERWLKLDKKRVRHVRKGDVLLFEDLTNANEFGFFFGTSWMSETDRYAVQCREDRPLLLRANAELGDLETKFEELDFKRFVELSADYKTVKRIKPKGRGFDVTESPLEGPESLAALFEAKAVLHQGSDKLVSTPAPARPLTKAPAVAKGKNRYGVAVVIGNGDYQSAGKGVPNVDYAHNDAEAIRDYVLNVLGFREGNVMFLKDATHVDFVSIFGTKGNAKGKLHDWLRPEKSDVFVYYSGHGAPALSNGQGYLLSVDADPQRVELSGYELQTLYDNLAQLPVKSLTVVLDACFSGSSQGGTVVKNASSISLRVAKPQKKMAHATLLTASGVSEVASWDPETKHGLFTRYFLDGVAGLADGANFGNGDGKVTLGELKAYLEEEVTYYARREYGRGQHPQVNGPSERLMAELK